jgi:hypothetical protein
MSIDSLKKVRAAALLVVLSVPLSSAAQFGAEVVSYAAGSTPTAGFINPTAAIGEPERYTGEGVFPGVVSPFSPPFLASEIVSVGEGGHITIKLSRFANVQSGVEIGVFENVGLEMDFGNGTALDPVSTFGADSALVEVSSNGIDWRSLGTVLFNRPTNGYTDLSDPFSGVPGTALSDFQQPFTADMSEFAGLPYSDPSGDDVLEVLAGSGGGTWLDISGTGLRRVGYIRFSVADDFTSASQNFELDAISIAHGAVGSPVPEPATGVMWMILAAVTLRNRRRSRADALARCRRS